MPRRRRFPWLLLLAVFGGLAVAGLYVVGMAAWQAGRYPFYRFEELLSPRMVDVFVAGWLLWMGSSIGSFLNVVVWRMPRGQSVGGRSHCPHCQTQLLARDNFPVLGWISLRGRCRTCRLPISPRYPIVEAAVGLSLTAVGIAELYRVNLPGDEGAYFHGPLWSPSTSLPILIIGLYHWNALSISWAFGLILRDGHRLPGRLLAFATLTTVVPMLAAPFVAVVSWRLDSRDPLVSPILDAVFRVLSAFAAAGLSGRSLGRAFCRGADLKLSPLSGDTRRLVDLIAMVSVPAIVIGWQSLPVVLLLASVIAVTLSPWMPNCDAFGRYAVAMPVAMSIQLITWRLAASLWWWPSESAEPWAILVAAIGCLFIPLWLGEREADPGSHPA